MSILVQVTYMVIYYFRLRANYVLGPLCVLDFLLCAVTSLHVCLLDIPCIQLVSFLSWVCGMYEYKK